MLTVVHTPPIYSLRVKDGKMPSLCSGCDKHIDIQPTMYNVLEEYAYWAMDETLCLYCKIKIALQKVREKGHDPVLVTPNPDSCIEDCDYKCSKCDAQFSINSEGIGFGGRLLMGECHVRDVQRSRTCVHCGRYCGH